ncbi:IDEAL domain-containing protein [Bacillus sp. CGMCC 1.16607]|uniref:IDEAL domain-containing protein n=1 Tax=Bacillus sp. CGMCC 1.16607 TaxID=3351842 RepID=UPI0036354140
MKDKSYTDLMKSGAMNRQNEKEAFVQNLYIEMFLREIQLRTKKEKLQLSIDSAIDKRDKVKFMQLSQQLNELNKCFGT